MTGEIKNQAGPDFDAADAERRAEAGRLIENWKSEGVNTIAFQTAEGANIFGPTRKIRPGDDGRSDQHILSPRLPEIIMDVLKKGYTPVE